MANNSLTAAFDALPKIARILLLVFLGWIICPVYRILRYCETKNIVTLVVGIVTLVTGIGNLVVEIVDIVTTVTNDKITVLAD